MTLGVVAVLSHTGPLVLRFSTFSRFPLILFVLRLLSLTLGAFVPPGVNQLPNKQLLDQSRPGIFGVAAVSGDAVGLDHAAAPERVDLRREAHRSAER